MRRIFGAATAVALALAAGAASAAEWTGTIEDIDEISRNITVSNSVRPDQTMEFAVSDTNTVGATIEDLSEGDRVRVFYAESGTDSGQPVNAMQIDQVAATETTGEVEGAIEGIDQTNRTVMIDGREYVVTESALSELNEGDEVRIVYVDTDTGEVHAVEVFKVQ